LPPCNDHRRLEAQHKGLDRQFHADEEEQHHDAEFGQQRHVFRCRDHAHAGGAERKAGQDEPHQRWLPEPHEAKAEKRRDSHRDRDSQHGIAVVPALSDRLLDDLFHGLLDNATNGFNRT
jgi:hypothetical protein